MAKRKKKSKVQRRGKLPRGNSAKRGKPRKSVRAKAANRTAARAKPKHATAKKAALKKIKRPAVESVLVDVIEQPAPGVITVTEIEETHRVN